MANPATINVTEARYFPITNSCIFIGRVLINSIVPRFLSLATKLMEIAGIKNKYTNGVILNNALIFDWFIRKKVLVKKYPFTTANTTKKMYAMGLLK
jgi:hypothetical protein